MEEKPLEIAQKEREMGRRYSGHKGRHRERSRVHAAYLDTGVQSDLPGL